MRTSVGVAASAPRPSPGAVLIRGLDGASPTPTAPARLCRGPGDRPAPVGDHAPTGERLVDRGADATASRSWRRPASASRRRRAAVAFLPRRQSSGCRGAIAPQKRSTPLRDAIARQQVRASALISTSLGGAQPIRGATRCASARRAPLRASRSAPSALRAPAQRLLDRHGVVHCTRRATGEDAGAGPFTTELTGGHGVRSSATFQASTRRSWRTH